MNRSESGRLGAQVANVIKHHRFLERRALYRQNPKRCLDCQKPIKFGNKRWQKFCDRGCAARFNNKFHTKFGPTPSVPRYFCSICNKRTENSSSLCRDHLRDYLITSGDVSDRNVLKRWLIKLRGRYCECCGGETWCAERIPIELHHEDGNAANNLPDNLKLLCPNCHAQTPNAKGRNRGNGRRARGLWLS